MYCPKCGTENADTNKYCRACRENLGVISQAMKQRLPVMIASRLDQIFDSRSERFRRDSVLSFLTGLIFLIGGSLDAYNIHALLISCLFFLLGVWSYLAYRRGLAPDFDWEISNKGTKNSEPFDKSRMFCPKCGQPNERENKFCRGCGENLKVISKAMERSWWKALNQRLDDYVRSSNRKLPESARQFRKFWWIWLMIIVIHVVTWFRGGDRSWWVYPAISLPLLLAGLWDYVSGRRLLDSGLKGDRTSAQSVILPGSAAELPSAPTTNELATPFSVTESTTRRLEPLAAENRSSDLL